MEITFKRLDKVILESTKLSSELDEEAFLKMSFNIDLNALGLNKKLTEIIHERLTETEVCIRNEASLAAIFLIGSMMEGNLLGMATEYPCQFNQANSAPRNLKTDKVRRFYEWTLKDLIDVATEIGILKHDTKKGVRTNSWTDDDREEEKCRLRRKRKRKHFNCMMKLDR